MYTVPYKISVADAAVRQDLLAEQGEGVWIGVVRQSDPPRADESSNRQPRNDGPSR